MYIRYPVSWGLVYKEGLRGYLESVAYLQCYPPIAAATCSFKFILNKDQ